MKKLISLFAFFLFCAGCMVGPDYRTPEVNSPSDWILAQNPHLLQNAPINIDWWKTFSDPQLDSLISRAVAANLDFQIALGRLQQARALRSSAAWNLAPAINIITNITREKRSQTSQLFPIPQVRNNFYDAYFDASWEIDIFGGRRRELQAADAALSAAQEDMNDILLSVIAEVARNYIEYRGYQQRLDVLRKNITVQSETLDLTNSLFQAGISSRLDVEQAAAQLANIKSQQPTLETAARQSEYQLAVLLGLHPARLLDELSQQQQIPPVPPAIPIGLPSELLRRRPDIRRAERQLAQATANIGVATAEFFPKLILFGTAGFQSLKTDTWFTNDSRYWIIGPQFSWRLLDFGRVRAEIKAANAVQRQTLAAYEQAVLIAFQDVENSLIAYVNEKKRYSLLIDAVQANQRTLDLARDLYAKGLGDFLSVLEAQRSLYITQDQLVDSRRAVTQNLVSVYKALGGGWRIETPVYTDSK